jgi:hypothetical protein
MGVGPAPPVGSRSAIEVGVQAVGRVPVTWPSAEGADGAPRTSEPIRRHLLVPAGVDELFEETAATDLRSLSSSPVGPQLGRPSKSARFAVRSHLRTPQVQRPARSVVAGRPSTQMQRTDAGRRGSAFPIRTLSATFRQAARRVRASRANRRLRAPCARSRSCRRHRRLPDVKPYKRADAARDAFSRKQSARQNWGTTSVEH